MTVSSEARECKKIDLARTRTWNLCHRKATRGHCATRPIVMEKRLKVYYRPASTLPRSTLTPRAPHPSTPATSSPVIHPAASGHNPHRGRHRPPLLHPKTMFRQTQCPSSNVSPSLNQAPAGGLVRCWWWRNIRVRCSGSYFSMTFLKAL